MQTRSGRGWSGSATIGTGWAALDAAAGENVAHEHHAIQLCVAQQGVLRFAGQDDRILRGALVPSDLRHQLLPVDRAAMLYVLPESRLGRRLIAHYGHEEIIALETDLASALSVVIAEMACGAMCDTDAESALTTVLGLSSIVGAVLDARLVQVLAEIESNLERDQKLSDLAVAAGLSESRLAHLFREQLGLPYRPYRRWRRVERAFHALLAGGDLTAAAHAAGFSDSAHFSRSVVRAFGVPPLVVQSLLADGDSRNVQVPRRRPR